MRWAFPDPREELPRRKVIRRIDGWWREFASRAARVGELLREGGDWDLVAWMNERLEAISDHLAWEFVDGRDGALRLVITPEGQRRLRPLVDVLLRRAPRIPGWEFHAFRLPEELDQAELAVEQRTGLRFEELRVRATRSPGGLIDLAWTSPACAGPDDERAGQAAFLATLALLGERCVDQWIGAILVERAGDGAGGDPPEALPERVRASIDAARARLPESACHRFCDEARWSIYSLDSDPAVAAGGSTPPDDWPRQHDLLVGRTMLPEMWVAARRGGRFSSCRFSRAGETFCYLKIDGAGGTGDRLAGRSAIEDAVNATLVPAGLGCSVGGGTGLRYSYIDLALTDVPAAAAALREPLRARGVPLRTWLLFHDDELGDEWIGVWDDTPPPP